MRFIGMRTGARFGDYGDFWRWSVDNRAEFWSALWDHCEVIGSRGDGQVLENADAMPGAVWFPGARLNFAENLLRYRDGHAAIIFRDEAGDTRELSYAELFRQCSQLAGAMHNMGVRAGDRVAAVAPNPNASTMDNNIPMMIIIALLVFIY